MDPKTSVSVAMFIYAFFMFILFAMAWNAVAKMYAEHKVKQAQIKKGQTIWRRKN